MDDDASTPVQAVAEGGVDTSLLTEEHTLWVVGLELA